VEFETKVQELAYKYNIEELVSRQSEEDIYKEVELFVNSLRVHVKSAPRQSEQKQ